MTEVWLLPNHDGTYQLLDPAWVPPEPDEPPPWRHPCLGLFESREQALEHAQLDGWQVYEASWAEWASNPYDTEPSWRPW